MRFDISPKVDDPSGIPHEGVPQRCTRGHTWDIGMSVIGVRLDLSAFGLTEGAEEFCVFCLRDALREHCGRVKPDR